MEKIKISSLGIFDEQKFKKLSADRQNWLDGGADMLLNNSYKLNKTANQIQPDNIVLVISKVLQENDNYKTILLTSVNGEVLPIFRAGQKISVTLNIKNKYYTKPYVITSSPISSTDGEYKITVRNDEASIVDDYLYNKAKIGEKISVSSPFGDFYYSKIRDRKNIIAIVSGEGILPIYTMAQAILEKNERFNLTIFYTEKKEEDLLFIEELLEYDSKSNNIKVKILLSDDDGTNYEKGLVTEEKLREVFIEDNTTIFISGTEGLLKYLDKEIEKLRLPKKYIIYDKFLPVCNIKRVEKYTLTVYINDEMYEVPCYNNKTIMYALMEGGIYIPSKCHNGSCGYCRSELVLGEVKVINDKRTSADKKYNYIHPCTTYPLSDIEIIVR